MENLTINGNVYTPKFNFAFYKQISKEMANANTDGFSALVEKLLTGNVEAVIEAYYYSLAWYKRNQPSEDAVEEALEGTAFASDEATNEAIDDIIKTMHEDNFLARKLSEYIKNTENALDVLEERLDGMKDEINDAPNADKQNLEIGLKQMSAQLNKLKTLIGYGLTPLPTEEK